MRAITGSGQGEARKELLLHFVETYMALTEDQQEQFAELVESAEEYREVKKMITVYEQKGIEKGMRKGIEKGIEAGVIEGKQDDLILFCEARFGTLPEPKKAVIRAIRKVDRLSGLIRSVATAKTLDELDI